MNASEAVMLTIKGKQDTEDGFYNQALDKIRSAARLGWRQATPDCWKEHSDAVMGRLRALGYQVSFSEGGRHTSDQIIVRW